MAYQRLDAVIETVQAVEQQGSGEMESGGGRVRERERVQERKYNHQILHFMFDIMTCCLHTIFTLEMAAMQSNTSLERLLVLRFLHVALNYEVNG